MVRQKFVSVFTEAQSGEKTSRDAAAYVDALLAAVPELRQLPDWQTPWPKLEEALRTGSKESQDLWHLDGLCLSKNPLVLDQVSLDLFREYQGQVIVHTFFQHPGQCTRESFEICANFADSGVILSNTMDLVPGLNDSTALVKELNHRLLMMRVRPYTMNVRNKSDALVASGLKIMEELRGWTSGLAVPHFVVHEIDGTQKVLVPEYIKGYENHTYTFWNYRKDEYLYREQ